MGIFNLHAVLWVRIRILMHPYKAENKSVPIRPHFLVVRIFTVAASMHGRIDIKFSLLKINHLSRNAKSVLEVFMYLKH